MNVSPQVHTRSVTIDVRGTPRPQGSMKLHALPNGGTAARYPPAVYEWRARVQQAVADVMQQAADDELHVVELPLTGAVELRLGFDLVRPRGHYGTGRNLNILKPSAPKFPDYMPDLDKLVRCVSDAITDAGLWNDDGQVCSIVAAKRWATPPGVKITVTELR